MFSGVPRKFVRREGVQQIQLRTEDRGNWDMRAVAPYSGVLEAAVVWYKNFISYSKIFLIFGTLRLFMITTNLFVIAIVKQLSEIPKGLQNCAKLNPIVKNY